MRSRRFRLATRRSSAPATRSRRWAAGFGTPDSITTGVVSAIRRSIASLTSIYKVVDAIQTDAPITHGNSGGPLFDARGRVIGINAQIRTETGGAEGVGFAVPINAARRSMTQLAATGVASTPISASRRRT